MTITICASCIHHILKACGDKTLDLCAARPRTVQAVDVVSGAIGWRTVDRTGRVGTTQEPYADCRDVNDGRCADHRDDGRRPGPAQGVFRTPRPTSAGGPVGTGASTRA